MTIKIVELRIPNKTFTRNQLIEIIRLVEGKVRDNSLIKIIKEK